MIMSRVRYRLEVWDRDNSVRLAYAATASELRRRRVLKGEETISARITLHDYAADRVEEGCILRVQEIGEPTSYVLGRLTSVERSRAPNGALTCEISADALWMDLRQGLVRQIMSDGRPLYTWGLVDVSPLEWIRDVILPGYEGTGVTFEVGVVELATPVTLSFDDTTPLEALRMLEQACTEAEGAAELQFRPNATGTGYIVDLLHRVGATSGGAELRYRKNIVGLRRRREEYPVATRVRARGSGLLTLADAEWEIDAVGGTGGAHVLTFAGMHPVFEDGAFVDPDGPLYFFVPGKAAYPITASDATAGTLTVDDTGLQAPVSGDVGWIATDATGTRLDYLESPAGVALYGVRIGTLRAEDVPDAINTLPNGDFSEWSGGLPIGWSAEGSAVIQESTDHARRGGKSAHVTAAADGEGIVSEAVPVLQTEARPYTGMHVELLVVSGQVRIELRHSNGTVYPVQQRPLSTGLGVELELSANVHDEPLPAGTLQLAVVAHGGAAEWYLDAAMITPILAADVPGWVKRSGAWELWRRTAQHLATARQPRLEYDVQVVDLHRIAPDVFRFDAIELGDDVRLIDPDIARETVRVVEIEEEMLSHGVQRVVLAPSPELRLHDPYRETPPGSRYAGSVAPSPAPADVPRVLSVAAQLDPTDGKLYLSPLGNSRVATLELYLKTSRTGAYPSAPTATINGRQGAFPGQTLAAARYFKIVPKDGRGVAGDAWEGGGDSYAPTASARAATVSNGTAADAYVTPDSPIGEMLRVHVRDSDGEGAPVWSLVQGSGNPTPRYVADAIEVGPDAWFYDGSSYAQKLKGISLLRDQLRRIYVQAEGQLTGLRSAWTVVPLELRAQPWLESVAGAWNAAGTSIEVTAIGGAHCKWGRFQWSKDGFVTIAHTTDLVLADGQRATAAFAVPAEDRELPWSVRVIPFNGATVGDVAGSLSGAPQEAAVPPLPPEVVGAVDVLVIMPRWVYSGADAHLELVITYGSAWRSLRVEYQYSSVPGGPPDTMADYVFDLQAGGGNTTHLVEDADGIVRFWSPQDPPPTITVTPYEGPGGTGAAGTPQFIRPEDLAQSGAVGGRVGTTDDPGTVYQADRILFQHPESLGFQITTVGGVPVVRLDGIASVQQGGTGLSASPGLGGLLVGDGEGGYALLSRGSSGSVLQVAGDVVGWGPVPSHTHTFNDMTGQAKPSQLGIGADGAIVKKAKDSDSFISVTGQPGWVLTWDDLAGWEASPPPVPPNPLPVPTENNRFLQSAGGGWQVSSWGLPPGEPPEVRRFLAHDGDVEGEAYWGLPTWDELQNKPSVAITTQNHTISGLWTFRRGADSPSLIVARDGFQAWGIVPSSSGGVQRFTINNRTTGAAWGFYVTGRIDGPGGGNVGIGGDAVSTYMLSVAGSVRATAGFFDTSDVALKRDIVPLSHIADPRALLLALDPVGFRWRSSGELDVGFVAQSTPEPFLGPDGLTIAYHRIVATLVAGWQDHERRLRALELALEEVRRGLA